MEAVPGVLFFAGFVSHWALRAHPCGSVALSHSEPRSKGVYAGHKALLRDLFQKRRI